MHPAHLPVSLGSTVDDVTSKVSPAVAFLKDVASTDLAQQIEHGIQRFAENMPWLMKSLDELARIHPVVTGISFAFHAPTNKSLRIPTPLQLPFWRSRRCMRSRAPDRKMTAGSWRCTSR